MKAVFLRLMMLVAFIGFTGRVLAQENPVKWKISAKKISDCEYDILFDATIDEGWHLYSIVKAKGEDTPNPTRIKFNKNPDYETVGALKESTPLKEFDKVFETDVLYFKHKATFTQRVKALSNKKITVSGKYEFQTCTDAKCVFPPAKKFNVEIEGGEGCVSAIPQTQMAGVDTGTVVQAWLKSHNPCDSGKKEAVSVSPQKTSDNTKAGDTQTAKEENKPAANNDLSCNTPWWVIFLKGIGFGLAALITPCVFPMIPMNVSFFLKRNKTKGAARREAFLFMACIALIYTALGLLLTAIFGPTVLYDVASSASFNLVFFAILVIFGISFLGAFEITLPSSWTTKLDANSDKGGILGIFFMAATLSLVSFSCTSVFIGTLLTSVTDCFSGPLWGFFGFGVGFAIPFGFFAMVPGMLQSLPKSGGWLNSVKVVLGLLELALALKFASNADLVHQAGFLKREVFLALWIILFALMGIYLMGWFKLSHDSEMKYLSIPRLFFAMIAFGFTIYIIPGLWGAPLKLLTGVIPPSTYAEAPKGFGGGGGTQVIAPTGNGLESKMVDGPPGSGLRLFHNDYESAFGYAKQVGKPLMIDFTGHSCANCRKMEDNVWIDDQIKSIMTNEIVIVSLYVDDEEELPKQQQQFNVKYKDEEFDIITLGDKWKNFGFQNFNCLSQPYYVMLDKNGKQMMNGIGYDTGKDIPVFKQWLRTGIDKYKSSK